VAAALVPVEAAAAEPSAQFAEALRAIAKGRDISPERVTLDIPRLAESGNSVSLKVMVESPMTAANHVQTVHILSEQNPVAVIVKCHFGPRSGRAEFATNIRLATTQNVHAIAETSDGRLWQASTEVVVLIAACLDGS
jgi:sulfur-oxidizing protein SoxY